MTDEKALKILTSIEILAFRDKTKKYFMKDVYDAQKVAIKALEQISHLKDRPCEACEFYTEKGCSKWECVFEGSESE